MKKVLLHGRHSSIARWTPFFVDFLFYILPIWLPAALSQVHNWPLTRNITNISQVFIGNIHQSRTLWHHFRSFHTKIATSYAAAVFTLAAVEVVLDRDFRRWISECLFCTWSCTVMMWSWCRCAVWWMNASSFEVVKILGYITWFWWTSWRMHTKKWWAHSECIWNNLTHEKFPVPVPVTIIGFYFQLMKYSYHCTHKHLLIVFQAIMCVIMEMFLCPSSN